MSEVTQQPHSLSPILRVVWQRLRGVLDPELDESILELGFVESVQFDNGHVTLELRLPTTWCSPNFAYMMAEDIRTAVLSIDGVRQVTVLLLDHFAAGQIESGVNAGMPFQDAFPDEALGDLQELRVYFLQKGFLKRQERLLRSLRQAGLSFPEIATLHVGDLEVQGDVCRIRRKDGSQLQVDAAQAATRYLERRSQLGFDCSPTAVLVTDTCENPISSEKMGEHFVMTRTIRVAQDANGSMCCALLAARQRASRECFRAQTER